MILTEQTILKTKFNFPYQTNVYYGKVRDLYTINNKYLIMVVTDRISAFDVVLPKAIPFKGQVLNQIASKFLEATKDIVPNWVIDTPDPNVTIGKKVEPFKVEMVIRAYLSGHAWREYKSGKRELCGVKLENNLKENDKLRFPIITPTTKTEKGHDEDISKEYIINTGLVDKNDYKKLEDYTYALFERGTKIAKERGLILVDTKYEFGKDEEGNIYLIDEVHTPDSSRYFYSEGYEERQEKGEKQKQLSKEFVREWLIENGFQGKKGQKIPEITDDFVNSVSKRYIELYEQLTGEKFIKRESDNILSDIEKNILKSLSQLF